MFMTNILGQTLARLDTDQSAQNGSSSQGKPPLNLSPSSPANIHKAKNSKKRQPGEAVSKHTSNKRKRIGLDTIPQDAKTATFDTIPEKIKIDLFDNVVRTALPNFDNLMMASWNVVSVYSNVGTDFPELHKSIVELKSVLQDFEDGFGSKKARIELPVRKDFAPPPQDGANGADGTSGFGGSNGATGRPSIQSAPEATQDGANDAATAPQEHVDNTSQQDDSMENLFNDNEPEPATTEAHQDDMPPPDLMQMIKRHDDAGDMDDENDSDSFERQLEPRASSKGDRHASILRSTPEQHTRRPTESPLFEREHPSPFPTQARDAASPELLRRRDEYASSLIVPPKPKLRHALAGASDSSTITSKPKPKLRYPLATPIITTRPSSSNNNNDSSTHTSRSSSPNNKEKERKSLADISTSDLRAAYKKRKAELIRTFSGNNNVPQQYRVQMQRMMAEIKAREQKEAEEEEEGDGEDEGSGEGGGGGRGILGKSVLGAKKVGGNNGGGGLGSAPVAPMLHLRKDGGGAGGVRRG